jgi:hypothetical protein
MEFALLQSYKQTNDGFVFLKYLFCATSFDGIQIRNYFRLCLHRLQGSGKTKESVLMKALSYISLALYQMRVKTQSMQFRVL